MTPSICSTERVKPHAALSACMFEQDPASLRDTARDVYTYNLSGQDVGCFGNGASVQLSSSIAVRSACHCTRVQAPG